MTFRTALFGLALVLTASIQSAVPVASAPVTQGDQGLDGGWSIDDSGNVDFVHSLSSSLGTAHDAGAGWVRNPNPATLAWGIAERVDDYCATSFVYCRDPQPVPRLDVNAATADIGRRPYEQPGALEVLASFTQPPG